jgi:hypothetical protein
MTDTKTGGWWIATDELAKGGEKILGPFESRDLALEVRVYVEAHPRYRPRTFWVDQEQAAPTTTA